jgi:rhomboid protease GluP
VSGRTPWLTLLVLVVTSVVTGAMLVRPEIGTTLQRDPAMLHGEWWRFVTTWLVLTDGWTQIALNSIALLIFGTLVERGQGRAWWIVVYVVAGLVGEIAGIFWQPIGGGNSVAICGLIGLFSVGLAARTNLPPPVRGGSFGIWGALGVWLTTRADIHGAALLAGFAVGGAWRLLGRRERDNG